MKEKKKIDKITSKEKAKKWQDSNKNAIEDYNKRIKQKGLFGDRFRNF